MILGPQKRTHGRPRQNIECRLRSAGWEKATRLKLERTLGLGAGRNLPVVFDFDNTIVSGDIGEAVLAVLGSTGRLTPKNICETLSPALRPQGNSKLSLAGYANIMKYYEALLAPTVHGKADPTPLANGYVWAAQVLETLSLAEVIDATLQAIRPGENAASGHREIIVGKLSYPAPRFREEMVELIALLLRLGYRPWIVSASNVWSVRCMVVHALNPLLAKQGAPEGLPPEQVIGLATLLSDRTGRLYKDSVLVRQDPGYSNLSSKRLKSMHVTRHIQFPAPVYSGKVACILDAIGQNPYLSAGDSPSDHPMLSVSQNRLWIARADKPNAQLATQALMRRTGKTGWIVHPVAAPGRHK